MTANPKPVTLKLRGVSGTIYEYTRLEKNQQLMGIAGNFLFTKEQANCYLILFVGHTASFAQDLAFSLWEEAVRDHQASHIFTHIGSRVLEDRAREQRDLITALNPLLNDRRPDR